MALLFFLVPVATFLFAINHPRAWGWLCQRFRLRATVLCVLIAAERTLPLLLVNPTIFLLVYLPEYTALDLFDVLMPVLRVKNNHTLLGVLAFLINYLVSRLVLTQIAKARKRAEKATENLS